MMNLKDAASYALEQLHEAGADDAAGGGHRIEGAHEDHFKGMHHAFEVREDDGERSDDVDEGHDRDHLFGERGDATDTADEDEAADGDEHHADDPRRHVEGV